MFPLISLAFEDPIELYEVAAKFDDNMHLLRNRVKVLTEKSFITLDTCEKLGFVMESISHGVKDVVEVFISDTLANCRHDPDIIVGRVFVDDMRGYVITGSTSQIKFPPGLLAPEVPIEDDIEDTKDISLGDSTSPSTVAFTPLVNPFSSNFKQLD